MKAKDWWDRFKNVQTDEELEKLLDNCLKELVQDADKLITIRRAKSDKAVAACINEVNNRWIAIYNLFEKEKDTFQDTHPLYKAVLFKDGFKAAYVKIHPNRGWYFDMKAHARKITRTQEYLTADILYKPVLIMYGLTTYNKMEEFTVNDLRREFLHAAYVLGKMSHEEGFPNNEYGIYARVIATHMQLLQLWVEKGTINQDDVKSAYFVPQNILKQLHRALGE